ncbi:MAG: hypothetical protein CMP66_02295 [Flavobacteriales bacterium]|nr:hypothetical protein [Flavobacteriales bacterium]
MYTGLSHLHHYLPYVLFFLMGLVILKSIKGILNQEEYTKSDKKLGLFAMIVAHVQLTVGIALYFISDMVIGLGDAMNNATTRLYALEHPLMMVIAIVLLTMARSKTKNLSDVSAHKKNLLFFVLALAAILSRIPWDQWLN